MTTFNFTKTFYFTFGYGQVHENGFHKVIAKDYGEARELMFNRFGRNWAFQYSEEQWYNKDGISQQEEFNLREIK